MIYDYLIIGAGLFGSVCAYELNKMGAKVLVVERRPVVGGNIYTEYDGPIQIHKYGAHIFRTNSDYMWRYVNSFVEFMPFINSPMAIYKDEIYNLPFNMNTFSKMWGVKTPAEAKYIIDSQVVHNSSPKNLEEYVLSKVGKDIYEKLIKGYTEKQWGKKCTELPPEIMKRIPIRFTYDNNYYSGKKYQGIPVDGYIRMIKKMLEGIEVRCNVDGAEFVRNNLDIARKVIYTGCIDEFLGYCFGRLEYRSVNFAIERLETENYQGVAVVNYTDSDVPYTRIIEHKHFTGVSAPYTIISREYPVSRGEPAYPIPGSSKKMYAEYSDCCAKRYPNIIFCGRLGSYKYLDMEETIVEALNLVHKI